MATFHSFSNVQHKAATITETVFVTTCLCTQQNIPVMSLHTARQPVMTTSTRCELQALGMKRQDIRGEFIVHYYRSLSRLIQLMSATVPFMHSEIRTHQTSGVPHCRRPCAPRPTLCNYSPVVHESVLKGIFVLKLNLKLKFYETVSKHVAVGNGLRVLPTRRWVYAGSQRCPRTSFKMSYTSGRRKGSDIIHCPIDVKQT